MNKLQQIAQDLKDNPTLFDYYSYSREWTTQELNQLMLAEYLEDVKSLATKMNRSEYSVILKYLELRETLDNKLAFDIKLWEGQYTDNDLIQFPEDWNTDEFIKGISVANMKVGQILEVLVRIVDPELRENIPSNLESQWSHFLTVNDPGGAGGLFGSTRVSCLQLGQSEHDPDKWGILRFKANRVGPLQIGMAVRNTADDEFAISKTMFVNIQED
jgi:hypothetical protein